MTDPDFYDGDSSISVGPSAFKVFGGKWGASSDVGTSGGTVTWSIAGAGWTNQTGGEFFSGSSVALSSFLPNDYVYQLTTAFAAWSQVANINFVQVADSGGNFGVGTGAHIRIGGGYIDGDGGPYIGRAYGPPSSGGTSNASATSGDIIFDNSDTEWTSPLFYAVALHEIGHALGLDHVPQGNPTAVMNPTVNVNIGLQPDDISGIRYLYGIRPVAGSVSINDVSIDEGTGGTKVLTFTVTRTGGSVAFSINYATVSSTASSGSDYVATSGTLSFASGINAQTISVTINGDAAAEANELFFVNLSDATNGVTISDGQGEGTIINDDTLTGSIAIGDASVVEGNAGTKVLTFTVTRTGGTAPFNVNYATSGGTATTADGDYVAASGTLSFGTGATTQSVSVTINGDTRFEANETFSVVLSGATNGASISDGQGTGTITNDDAAVPDLDVLNTMTVSKQTVLFGTTTTVGYTLANVGSASVAAPRVGVYRSADAVFDASDVLLTERTFGQLNPQAQGNDSFALTLSTLGTYFIIAVADYNNQVAGEPSETNNSSNAVQVTVSESEMVRHSDGTYTYHRLDALSQQSYREYYLYYDAQQRETRQVTYNDNGTRIEQGWDPQDLFAWSSYVVNYDSQGRATTQNTSNDNGTRLRQVWDTLSQASWSDYRVTYDSLGRETDQVTHNDNGTSVVQAWDAANQSSWSSYTLSYDSQGRYTDQITNNDNGSRIVQTWDAANQGTWWEQRQTYDSQSRLTEHVTVNDNGSRMIQVWDVLSQAAWSNYVVSYDGLGRATVQTFNNDNGTHVTVGWDAANQFSWSEYRLATDTLNRATRQSTANDNGSRIVQEWDPSNQASWTDYRVNYDALGRATDQVSSNDDGTHFKYEWDVQNRFSWSDYRLVTDALGRPTSQSTLNDNGSRIVQEWDASNRAGWTDYRTTYDSLGRPLDQVTNNDDGTHFRYGWDAQNRDVWSDYVTVTDSLNRPTSQTTNFDNGTHTIMTWDVLNQHNWAYKTDFFDAQWRHTAQSGVYDNGSTWMA
jgi:YD repeat-containing protein